ncbi:MAG: acyltransferase [Chitinophagaceae bacterium]|nr:MAG: acyltransferase [Chitinophagaceae bacterium]
MKKNQSIIFLDGLRGLAALYVMIGHARWLLWEGWGAFRQHPDQYSAFEKMEVYFFSLFKYGHEAVLFFFVLSGFVIHLKQAKTIAAGKLPSLNGYFVRRVKRIMPPFLFALLLTFVCDKAAQFMDASIYHKVTPDVVANTNISFDHSLLTLAGNLFFFQNTYVPVFGSNAPLWSLKYEWWFYMLYPILLLLNKRSVIGSFCLVAILSMLSLLGWSWSIKLIDEVLAYFFCWWLGCLTADVYAGRLKIHPVLFVLGTALLAFIPINSIFTVAAVKDTVIAIGFWGLLNLLLLLNSRGVSFPLLGKLKPLGDCSYTLYVIHLPLLVLMNGLVLKNTQNVLPTSMLFVWLSVFVILILSYLIHLFIERPFTGKSGIKPELMDRSVAA